jgi:hypothetical protein
VRRPMISSCSRSLPTSPTTSTGWSFDDCRFGPVSHRRSPAGSRVIPRSRGRWRSYAPAHRLQRDTEALRGSHALELAPTLGAPLFPPPAQRVSVYTSPGHHLGSRRAACALVIDAASSAEEGSQRLNA